MLLADSLGIPVSLPEYAHSSPLDGIAEYLFSLPFAGVEHRHNSSVSTLLADLS